MNLPNIFQNKNIKVLNNQQDLFYGKDVNNTKESKNSHNDIRSDIKKLFTSKNYVYKLECIITTKNKTINTFIIGQTNSHLITINNELIPIKDILEIKEKGKL